jgi:hypothetical protein
MIKGRVYRAGVEIKPAVHYVLDSNLEYEIKKYKEGESFIENDEVFKHINFDSGSEFNPIFSMIERYKNYSNLKDIPADIMKFLRSITVIRCIDLPASKKSGLISLDGIKLNRLLDEKNVTCIDEYINKLFHSFESDVKRFREDVIFPYRVTYFILLHCAYIVNVNEDYINQLDKLDEVIKNHGLHKYEISYYASVIRILDGFQGFIPCKPNKKTKLKAKNGEDIHGLLPYLNGTAYDIQLLSFSDKLLKASDYIKEIRGIILTKDKNLNELSKIFSLKRIVIDKKKWEYEIELDISKDKILNMLPSESKKIYSERDFSWLSNPVKIAQTPFFPDIESKINEVENLLREQLSGKSEVILNSVEI